VCKEKQQFRYFETNLRNKFSIQEEIKRKLKSGNACCHSVQNVLSSRLLSRNLKIKISIYSLVLSLEGRAWQEPEPSHVTGMALAHCILGKFLGVVCHCYTEL